MVLLVVALLTTAIVMRSMDRTKNASNVRINQKVLAAVNPAIERAEAKVAALLADPTLPRSTPTDQALYNAMTGDLKQYTLGDETPLKLVDDFGDGAGGTGSNGSIEDDPTRVSLDNLESLTTAWKFPVDTDNNGKFDSYSLYGIYFRNPTQAVRSSRARTPLEARNPPVDPGAANSNCGAGTAASLVGASGWYKTSDGNLKKSFFVFAATVPITDPNASGDKEPYKGNKGFAAIEVQQDQARIPLTNNAVVYDDDLEITPGSSLRLNGRIMTNSNFFIGERGADIRFYQVSSPKSCFYTAENGKITVGGNVVVGSADPIRTVTPVEVDLFREGTDSSPNSFDENQGSVAETADQTSYNSQAYTQRIAQLVKVSDTNNIVPEDAQRRITAGTDRIKALQDYYKDRTRRVPFKEVADPNAPSLDADTTAPNGLGNDDVRPRNEWHYPADLASGTETNSLTLRKTKPDAADPDNNIEGTDEEKLGDRVLVGNGLPAKWWNPATEKFVDYYNIKERQPVAGTTSPDSITWTDGSTGRTRKTQFVPLSDLGDTDRDGYWEQTAAKRPEQSLDAIGGLRVVTGAGIYSPADSFLPRPTFPFNPITDDPSTAENEAAGLAASLGLSPRLVVTLPDSMPMWEDTDKDGTPDIDLYNASTVQGDKRGDLIMRATAVYHYRESSYPNSSGTVTTYPDPLSLAQKPIACVSSYYNPTTSTTAKNRATLPDGSTTPSWTFDRPELTISSSATPAPNGLSNNGISYGVPSEAETPAASLAGITYDTATGVFTTPTPVKPTETGSLPAKLNYQANLIFPDGRFVNEPLRKAMKQLVAGRPLTLAHQSSLASEICAIKIIEGSLTPSDTVIPHGTIYETTFLDARQVKALEDPNQSTLVENDYDLSIEERQPLEIRATVLDLDKLRKKAIAGQSPMNGIVPATEYLLPDSGIIYATREDALLDLSAPSPATGTEEQKMAARKLNSPVDFKLDPSRRTNGIMLINGSILARGGAANVYKAEEKGLILASNLPVYVKADDQGFNLHQNATSGAALEEFDELLAADFSNFYPGRQTASTLFACRKDQPGLNCDPGDLWRPATVLADSVTLLSDNFRFGFRNEGDYDLRKNVDNLANNLHFDGYDFDGDGNKTSTIQGEVSRGNVDLNGINGTNETIEDVLGLGLDGDGANTPDVPEANITITAARRLNGFFDNNYLTSADWFNSADGFPKSDFDSSLGDANDGSSYVNNFVTPIQRRANFPEYVMEICRKPLVEQCGPTDWVVGYDTNGNGRIDNDANSTPNPEKDVRAWELIPATEDSLNAYEVAKLGAGTTASLAIGYDANGNNVVNDSEKEAEKRYPRRIAFLRTDAASLNRLVLDSNTNPRPVPLGINSAGKVQYYPYQDLDIDRDGTGSGGSVSYTAFSTINSPRRSANALWFKTTTTPADPNAPAGGNYGYDYPLFYQNRLAATTLGSGSTPGVGFTQQPLLVPVLQLHLPTLDSRNDYAPLNPNDDSSNVENSGKNWMQTPVDTKFNLIIAAGDTPTRKLTAATGEFNGGMPNFPIFLENWNTTSTAKISGSFIQYKRSAYATAPFVDLLNTTPPITNSRIFNYPQIYRTGNSGGASPYYTAPIRAWGFDVGLLPQLPDAFSQRITTPSAGEPNKFYRELSRNDEWVKTLLCAKEARSYPIATYDDNAVDDTERPSDCN